MSGRHTRGDVLDRRSRSRDGRGRLCRAVEVLLGRLRRAVGVGGRRRRRDPGGRRRRRTAARARRAAKAAPLPRRRSRRVLADDAARETRQLGVVTADGRAAAFTGRRVPRLGRAPHGRGFAVQGNILAGEAVVDEMERAFTETVGAARRAARRCARGRAGRGRRPRGQQSAAVSSSGSAAASESREGIDRICDLRVEDHPEPIAELRRLVGIWTDWDALRRADVLTSGATSPRRCRRARAVTASRPRIRCCSTTSPVTSRSPVNATTQLEHVRRAIALDAVPTARRRRGRLGSRVDQGRPLGPRQIRSPARNVSDEGGTDTQPFPALYRCRNRQQRR